MKEDEKMLERIKKEAGEMEIPKRIEPEQMRCRLMEESKKKKTLKKSNRKKCASLGVAAACVCMLVGGVVATQNENTNRKEEKLEDVVDMGEVSVSETTVFEESTKMTYEQIYASMNKVWEQERRMQVSDVEVDGAESTGRGEVETAVEESTEDVSQTNSAFGTTNVQTQGVEEGDIIKNDGRYLYQIVDGYEGQEIQIADTKDGLKEVTRLDEFQNIAEFYIWEDVLVVIENKYKAVEGQQRNGIEICDELYTDNSFQEISFYNIKNRAKPKKIKTFTLDGSYASSRIADGYFYGFSRYSANPGEGEEDYNSYIPDVDGVRLGADSIYLPEETQGTSYLVLVSVDLKNPTSFVQTMAVVSGSNLYYVSEKNIYVTDWVKEEEQEGWNENKTALLRFSYADGKFALEAQGEVKGELDSSFSMDEYNGYLRVVSTVWEYNRQILKDDRTGKMIGYEVTEDRETNALYVLNENLEVVGKVEGLAEGEEIYAARFMGETGYFVTFRQTDPLFAVDLSNPRKPKVLSELKVSGFSDYLHFYGEDRLLGIGMEADEETGRQEGMKLSMFDISNPEKVEEIAKLSLEQYEYSEALYNHKAVLISTEENIFGFTVEGYNTKGYYRKYLVFSYQDESFVKDLEIEVVQGEEDNYYSARGTFVGDVFYLLRADGVIRSYDRNTGRQLEVCGVSEAED